MKGEISVVGIGGSPDVERAEAQIQPISREEASSS
jgi:hypothetical protein